MILRVVACGDLSVTAFMVERKNLSQARSQSTRICGAIRLARGAVIIVFTEQKISNGFSPSTNLAIRTTYRVIKQAPFTSPYYSSLVQLLAA